MAPNARVGKAFRAMKVLGISEDKVKPVLKRLLRLYDKNWEPIEEENYRVLLDAIFDHEDQKEETVEDSRNSDELGQPLKRRLRDQGPVEPSSSHADLSLDEPLFKRPKVEGEILQTCSIQSPSHDITKPTEPLVENICTLSNLLSSQMKEEPGSSLAALTEEHHPSEMASEVLLIKDSITIVKQSDIVLLPEPNPADTLALITPKVEPLTDDKLGENTLSVALQQPETSTGNTLQGEPVTQEALTLQTVDKGSGDTEIKTEESSPSLYIASSPLGEVKISISCSSIQGRPKFNMPSLDELRKSMEEKCLRSYKIVDPSFSFTNLMKDMCECFLELANNSSSESQDGILNNMPSLGQMEKSSQDALEVGDKMVIQSSASNESSDIHCPASCDSIQVTEEVIVNDHLKSTEEKDETSLLVLPQDITLDVSRAIQDVDEITMVAEESTEENKPKGENTLSVAEQHPETSTGNKLQGKPVNEEPLTLQTVDKGSGVGEIMSEESSPSLYVASSPLGEVRITISCSSAPGRPDFKMPNLDELRKSMEEKCLRSYKIVDPSFSFTNLMKDMCECFLDLATNSSSESQEGLLNNTPSFGLMEKSSQDAFDDGDKMVIQSSASNELALDS
ncbi:hypothetical protein ACFE04_013637 [Oxalis oulophora]